MLLRQHCIRDRQCESCDFEQECIVRRIMYSKMEIQPDFMSSGDSVGYVFECEDYHESFMAGDMMKFSLLLFGKTIVYFSQILDAIYRLGLSGIGKNKRRFSIVGITNTLGEDILSGNNIDMKAYKVMRLEEYVKYRMKTFPRDDSSVQLKLNTPLSLKSGGKQLEGFDIEPFISAVIRRMYMLNCFEGKEFDMRSVKESLSMPKLLSSDTHKVYVPRYSNRKDEKMNLWGLEGAANLADVNEDVLSFLLAGELIHIGKNTSFGFGRYHCRSRNEND